jgi:putative membrane protein
MNLYLALVLALAVVALIFTVQNVAAVDVTFLVWTISMSRALLILFTLSIGFLLGWFLHAYYAYRNASRKSEGESRK